nr:IQ and ubiquitin-like domain-containing protein [Nomia melanderi]
MKTQSFGWRHKVTGAIYWNASTQTGRRGTVERVAQTEHLVDEWTVTQRDVGVQSCTFPDARDRLVEARPTSSSPDRSFKDSSRNRKILESVVKIQRFYRAHRDASGAGDTDGQQVPEPRSYRSRDFVILNRSSPRTRTDFELLYNLLDRWRVCETGKAESLPRLDPSRIGLCSLILSKEVELLRAIDSLKTAAKRASKESSYSKFLDDLSSPIVWRNRRDEPVHVDTPLVQLARSFKERFNELREEDTSVEERKKTLRQLRQDIEPHTCRASNEVIGLLDQELDLLALNVDGSKLNWLRGRLKMAFLTFARDTLATRTQCVQFSRLLSRRKICRSCGRLLPLRKFPKEKARRSSSCNCCLYARVRAAPRIVYGPYECLLRDVRRNEARLRCYTSLAFVVDSKLVYHLVNDIWHGKSGVSGNDRLSELRLVRFRNDAEWSPWNCLLLTATEAAVHRRVKDPGEFYGPMVLQKFHTRNLQARVQFEAALGFERLKNPPGRD